MEAGKVTFNKPDFDNDAASQVTDVAPEADVPHDTVAVPQGEQQPGGGDEAYSPTATHHHAGFEGEQRAVGEDDQCSPTATQPRPGVKFGSPADGAGLGPSAKPKVHLHRVSLSTTDRHMNPGRRPTRVQFAEGFNETDAEKDKAEDTDTVWAARTDRARRLSSVQPGVITTKLPFLTRAKNTSVQVVKGAWTMFSTFPYWDMAFWSSSAYSVGSVLFIIVGGFEWAPVAFPDSEFPGETDYAEGIIFFIGALLYEFGAVMAYLEAINDGSFAGTGMKRFLEGHDDDKKSLLDDKLHNFFGHIIPHHHHHDDEEDLDLKKQASVDPEAGWRTRDREERPGSVYPEGMAPAPRREAVDHGEAEKGGNHEYLTWQWYATWDSFKNYHIKQPGYVACSIQLFGATLYGIDGVVALPKVTSGFTHSWQTLVASWIPAVVGSVCFLTASILFTLITQERWNKPAPWKISWWIGIWAGIGSVGFLLNGIFGLASLYCDSWTEYQSTLSTLWGSAAYLFSALLQWYESVNQGPVLAFPNNRIPTLLR